jgi:hypothetical protein
VITHLIAATWRLIIASILTAVIMASIIIRALRFTRCLVSHKRGAANVAAIPQQDDNTVRHADALDASGNAQWLPVAAGLISTAAHAVVRNSHIAVNITIADSITVESMQSIMRHSNIKHLHLQLDDVTRDVITAIPDVVIEQSLMSKCLESCTIDNFELLDAATATVLLQNMPDTLHTLTIRQSESARFDKLQFGRVICPASVKTLSMTCIAFEMILPQALEKLYVIDCSMLAWLRVPSTLLELHSTNMKSILPELPHGLLKLQMHSTNKINVDVPLERIPSTVTHLKLAETQTTRVPVWPPQLQVLDVGCHYLHTLDTLPDTLTELYVKLCRKVSPTYRLETLPPQLKVLDISRLKLSQDFVLPETLEVLRLDMMRAFPALPNGLKELKLAGYGYSALPVAQPATLQILDLRWAYFLETKLDNSILPASLHTLYVFEQYIHASGLDHLRPSITVHRLGPRYDIFEGELW